MLEAEGSIKVRGCCGNSEQEKVKGWIGRLELQKVRKDEGLEDAEDGWKCNGDELIKGQRAQGRGRANESGTEEEGTE